jgi:hypothetical protein
VRSGSYYCTSHSQRGSGQRDPGKRVRRKWKLAKKTKKNDAIMTGILVTRFKMGQINVEDLELMAADASRTERCSAAKKVLEAIEDSA